MMVAARFQGHDESEFSPEGDTQLVVRPYRDRTGHERMGIFTSEGKRLLGVRHVSLSSMSIDAPEGMSGPVSAGPRKMTLEFDDFLIENDPVNLYFIPS